MRVGDAGYNRVYYSQSGWKDDEEHKQTVQSRVKNLHDRIQRRCAEIRAMCEGANSAEYRFVDNEKPRLTLFRAV